jgi:Ser/Thr protein kinase RdoA (MazF antagonist)
MSTRLERWVESQLGLYSLAGRRIKGRQMLIEVVAASGERLFAKQVHLERQWQAEFRAYRYWTPRLRGLTPQLHAADKSLQTLLVSAVPGQRAAVLDAAAHREAGCALRRLHGARAPKPGGLSMATRATRRLDGLLERIPGLFTEAETRFARQNVQRLAALPDRPKVPCHGDYRPQNWLVDDAGIVRVIDFGEARWHVPAFDLTHLYLGAWWVHPHLATAFFAGYGRILGDDELEYVRSHLVLNAMGSVWYGRNHGRSAREAYSSAASSSAASV